MIYGQLVATDAVDFTRQMSSVGWDLEFLSLESRLAPLSIKAARSEEMAVQKAHFSGRLHQMGASPKGFLTIGVPTESDNIMRFGNRFCGPEAMLNFNSDVGLDALTERGHQAYTISIRQEDVENCINTQKLHGADFADFQHKPVSVPKPDAHLRFQRVLGSLLEASRSGNIFSVLELKDDITGLFLENWFGCSGISQYRYAGRSRRLNRVIDYIVANLQQPISVDSICRECGIGRKTLERDFKNHFEVSPKIYIKLMRLSAVRKELFSTVSDSSIQEVASKWGFNHMSQFAADYKRTYCELPSATRARLEFEI